MDNIEDILRVLAEDQDDNDNSADCGTDGLSDEPDCQCGEGSSGLLSGLDPEVLLKVMTLADTLNKSDDNERFLYALKPLLHEENRPKVDSAARLLKLMKLLPVLRDSGLLYKML